MQPGDGIEAEIAHLRDLDLKGLRARWRSLVGRLASEHLPRHLLLRMLAYRLQADLYGDLDRESIRFLDRLGGAKVADASVPLPDSSVVRPGTVLVRKWNNAHHHVMAVREGYAWNGTTYRSLSEVAGAITGTKWNGPRFFGLREAKQKRARP